VNKAIRGEVDAKTALKTAQDQMNKKLKALGE
jgi:sugar ABC transporter, sugar-binding protein